MRKQFGMGNRAHYAYQTRIIKVTHPTKKDEKGEPVVLFEANVKIYALRSDLVRKINGVKIKYELKEDYGTC